MKITIEIIDSIKEIERMLITKEYNNLSSNGRTNRLSEKEVKKVLNEYGGTVTERPLETLTSIEMIKIDGKDLDSFRVDYDLYINNKPSDLTLSLEITNNSGRFIASIEDLHVM